MRTCNWCAETEFPRVSNLHSAQTIWYSSNWIDIQSRMQTCRKSSAAGNDAPDPLSQQLARWEWLKKEIWDCWERGAENGGAQVVQLLQPDLPQLVLHLRLNESQESCRCPQQQQRHVNIWTTSRQCVNNTHLRKRMKICHQIPGFNRRDKKNRKCDKEENKEIWNGILRFKTSPKENCATGLLVIQLCLGFKRGV